MATGSLRVYARICMYVCVYTCVCVHKQRFSRWNLLDVYMRIYVWVRIYVCVCVCLCVCAKIQ